MTDTITGLTKSQVKNLIEFIEFYFIDSIRQDTEIDNINYVIDMMDALTKLRSILDTMELEDKNKCVDLMTNQEEDY